MVERSRDASDQRAERDSYLHEEGLDLTTVFELLASSRRRYALYRMHASETGVVEMDDLVVHVAKLEADRGDARDEPGDVHRNRVRIALGHNHVPRLVEAGLVEYDRRSRTLRYRERTSLTEWLEHAAYREFGEI